MLGALRTSPCGTGASSRPTARSPPREPSNRLAARAARREWALASWLLRRVGVSASLELTSIGFANVLAILALRF
jgi:hypothetical protein